jgi:hypothetical protein
LGRVARYAQHVAHRIKKQITPRPSPPNTRLCAVDLLRRLSIEAAERRALAET